LYWKGSKEKETMTAGHYNEEPGAEWEAVEAAIQLGLKRFVAGIAEQVYNREKAKSGSLLSDLPVILFRR
jgi:hypothetical protein